MEILADVGGRPGIDCGGFCTYCYFRGVKPVPPFGCKHCLPFRKGCDYCTRAIIEGYPGFKPLDAVVFDVAQASYGARPDKVTISGGGDLSCYPDLLKLVRILGQKNVPVHLGYTSGKGFRRGDEADELVDAGVREVSFTVFATDPELRRKYMHDKHPEAALSNLRIFCERCDVYAAAVLLKGVNDGEVLDRTCQDLEDMGAKGLILMRFANHPEQGLILGNAPIIPGQDVHTVEEFRDTVTEMNQRYRIRITGTPLWDPETKAPFSLAHNTDRLKSLPELRRSATIITGSVAAPLLERIFSALGGDVNVVATKKDVACLMTIDDLKDIDLSRVRRTVVIPGRMLAHEREVKKELSRDGIDRLIVRGPDRLTVDGEMSISMTEEEVIELELEAFAELIDEINALGV